MELENAKNQQLINIVKLRDQETIEQFMPDKDTSKSRGKVGTT